MSSGRVPLIDEATGRFPDAYAPASVAVDAAAAQQASGDAAQAASQAATEAARAKEAADRAEQIATPVVGEDGKLLPDVIPDRLSDSQLSIRVGEVVDEKIATIPAASGVAATQPLLAKMKRGAQDATMLVIGDSTGNEVSEWVYLFTQQLARDWATHTVLYRLWNDTTKAYDDAVTIQAGSGSRTLTLYNCSVPGWTSYGPLGERFNAAVAVVQPDLVVISLGHNEDVVSAFPGGMRGRFLSLTESVAAACPSADIALVLQNPSRVDSNQAKRADLLTTLATQRGFGVIDVHQHFVNAGIPAAWYADNLHPSVLGSQQWADVVHSHFEYRPEAQPLPRQAPTLLSVGQNLLVNSDFAAFSGATPDSWANTGATLSKDTTNFETGTHGLRIQSAGAVAAFVQQNLTPKTRAAVLGSWVTLAVRAKVPATATGTQYRVALAITGGVSVVTLSTIHGLNGWRWFMACGFVPPAASNVGVTLYADSGSTGTADWTIDRVALVRGDLPRDLRLVA